MSKVKKIIFSNIESNFNCDDDCAKDGSCDCDYEVLEYVRSDLDKEVDGRILAIASVGRWNGRFSGYKIYDNNIRSILSSDCDYVEWYGDGYNVRAVMHHHDGTNYIEYRVIREDKNIQNLLDRLYEQKPVSRSMVNNYTKSLYPYIARICGWGKRF